MKIIEGKIQGRENKKRLLFALGRPEVELILGSLRATYKYFPITIERSIDRARLLQMIREIGRAFPEFIHRKKNEKTIK